MATKKVVLLSIVEAGFQNVASGSPHGAMMAVSPFAERVGLPPFHSRSGDGDPVDAASLDRDVSTDILETRAAKQLALAIDVMDIDVTVLEGVEVSLDVMSPSDAQFGHFLEPSEQICEEVAFKGDIAINVADDVE
jgi:hypothetical protein